MFLTADGGGNGLDLNDFFETKNNVIIIGGGERTDDYYIGGTVIKAASQYQQTVLDKLSDISYTFTFKVLSDTAYESNRLITEMQTIVFVLMMVVCIAGVSSGNLLATISCKKRYAIYFMCGMEWKTGFWITFAESLIKLATPASIGYTASYRWAVDRDFYALRVTEINIIMTVIFIVVIFLLTSLMPLYNIKRTSPVKILSEM